MVYVQKKKTEGQTSTSNMGHRNLALQIKNSYTRTSGQLREIFLHTSFHSGNFRWFLSTHTVKADLDSFVRLNHVRDENYLFKKRLISAIFRVPR